MAVTVLRGDKVVLIKPFDKMQNVGNMYEVADFTSTNIILRDCVTKVAACAVSVVDFSNYFDKVENAIGKWTKWQTIIDANDSTVGMYRTNYKKVEVKIFYFSNNKCDSITLKAKSTCNKVDDFNLTFGIRLAYMRAIRKFYKIQMKDCINKVTEYQTQISNISKNIEKMCKE